jgi:hypothetical protein
VTGDGAARWRPRVGRVAMGRVGEAAVAGGGFFSSFDKSCLSVVQF